MGGFGVESVLAGLLVDDFEAAIDWYARLFGRSPDRNVGCCDSSVGRHASRHHTLTQHPVMRSFEPGESWRWCFVDERIG